MVRDLASIPTWLLLAGVWLVFWNPPRVHCQTCATGWSLFDGNCYRYFRPSPRVTWNQAKQLCEVLNSHLVNIAGAAENAYVLGLIQQHAWIGLNDRDTEGVFRWDDQPNVVPPYTNFATIVGIPDNRGAPPGEDCAVIMPGPAPFFDGRWNDDPCDLVLRDVVCEQGTSAPPVPTTQPTTPPNLGPCPLGWTVYLTTCFKWFDSSPKKTWSQARQACIVEGGHLADIRSADENAAAHAVIMSNSWIGYNDIVQEATFTWDFTGDSGTYTNWNLLGGEPSDDPPGEDCVTMYQNAPGPGTWNDDKCELVLRDYLCERGLVDNRVTDPDVACPTGWSAFEGSCYVAVTGPTDFSLANQTCANEGAYLATIASVEENFFVHSQITVDSWIGYSDQVTEGSFLWVTGQETTYTNWFPGAPDDLAPGQDCTIMYADQPGPAEWNDQACSDSRGFVCERGRVVVDCNSTHMGFHVAKGLLRPFVTQAALHLNDPTCRVQENDDFYFLTWQLDQCANELNCSANGTYINVINHVFNTPITPNSISRARSSEVDIICKLYNLGTASAGPLAPQGLEASTSTSIIEVLGFGRIGGHMALTDSSFVNTITSFPYAVQLNDELFLRILIITDFGDVDVFARRCYGTPTSDPLATPQHTLIQDHCPVDDTVVIRPATANLLRFSVRTFEFVNEVSRLYVHCEFQVCPLTAAGSRCSQGCLTPGNRRKRQIAGAGSHGFYPGSLSLLQGPFVSARARSSSERTAPSIVLISLTVLTFLRSVVK